jgi:hypothetical protein
MREEKVQIKTSDGVADAVLYAPDGTLKIVAARAEGRCWTSSSLTMSPDEQTNA